MIPFPSIRLSLKQFAVRVTLLSLRGLVLLRRFFIRGGSAFFGPLYRLVRMGLRKTIVLGYRAIFALRRSSSSLSISSHRRGFFTYFNRFIAHVGMIVIALLAGFLNMRGGDVRAEGFGERSLLFSFVSSQLAPEVEEVTAETSFASREIPDYFGSGLVTGTKGIDFHSLDDTYVTTTVGGAVVAPQISESKPSVAPRQAVESYAIQSGDTLGGIAEQFGLSLNTLLWANGLSFRSTLKIGQTLSIPPVDGVVHKVKKGDTLSSIAKLYKADPENVIQQNRLASANDLSIGEELIIPGGTIQATVAVRTVAPVTSLFTSQPSTTPARTALPAGTGSWVWPSDLRSITQYYGWRHTGVDIDCNGHSVSTNTNYAAADGVVAYSGWRNGYGNTVEVNHGNGIMTRYGHHAKLYVSSGQIVTAGTPLGLCGTTGRSSGTHLHFEVILGGRFANPLEYVR